jgi:phthiocerol/phenolphthiocerol synthesis type-I polyketide synthase C
MSYRLPGGNGHSFWDKLVGGEDLVTEVEEGRWAKEKFFHPRKSEPASAYTFASGSLRDVLKFDAAFFGISPREAAQMDPQQRMLMQLSWEALEDAGLKASCLKGSNCGVFIGLSSFDYVHRLADDLGAVDSKTPTGNAGSIAANRISYFLDARGPSMPIDTACSSSLVAFHQAWNAMQIGDCDTAIVGGVSLHFHPLGFITFTKTGMLSRDGRCRTFAADADGYVRSEGGGVVILKALDQALKDGDRILAVVEGSGINCDGKTNGITVPSGEAQAALLNEVYTKFDIDPENLDFLEAHGTGTAIGDPIETWAIGNILGKRRKRPLPMGSVKSNLGHLEAASGMAGLMKVLLMFRHRIIPPNLHFNEPNPRIDFDDLNLRVVTEATPLPESGRLTVGINSFGFGGANAHLILSAPEKAGTSTTTSAPRNDLPFILSAKSPKALREVAARTADFLAARPDVPLYDISYALHERRDRLARRALCLSRDRDSLVKNLRNYASEEASSVLEAEALPAAPEPVFVFTGNGGQWVGMGQALFAGNAEFRRAVEEVDGIFADYAPFSLLPHFQPGAATDLDRTELAQPLIFAIQVGLVRALAAAGIKPAATLGHSLGEVAAAWAAGVLELEQAVRVIRLRSKHQQTTQNAGGMTAVTAPRKEVEALLADPSLDGIDVVISGENSPRSTTVAGSIAALASVEIALKERSVGFKRLDLPYPFHSPLMDSVVPGFAEELGEIFVGAPALPFYSTVTGQSSDTPLSSDYWEKNIREPVLFRDAVVSSAKDGYRIFLEIGPQPVLSNHVLHTLQDLRMDCHAVGVVTKDKCTAADFDLAIWRLILGGVAYDWRKHFRRRSSRPVDLPQYPWQAEEFALPVSAEGGGLVSNDKEHPLLGYRAHGKDWEWENHLDTTGTAWLAEHQVGGSAVFPAAGFVEMVLAAGALRHPDQPVQIEDFEIRTPLLLDERHSKTVRLKLEEHGGQFLISSRDRLSEDAWQPHVTGRIAAQAGKSQPALPANDGEENLRLGSKEIYEAARHIGLDYGPAFQAIETVTACGRTLTSTLRVPETVEKDLSKFLLHPSLLDGSLHSLFALFHHADGETMAQAFLPVRIDRFVLNKPRARVTSVRTVIRRHSHRSLMADFYLLDRTGSLVAWAYGWRFRAAQLVRHSFGRSRILGQRWVARPRPAFNSAFAGQGASVAGTIKRSAEETPSESLLKRYPVEGDALADALCASFALEAFRQLADKDGYVSLDVCRASGQVADGMEDYFRRLAGMLVQDGLAQPTSNADQWQLPSDTDTPAAREIWQSLVADFPEKAARFALLGRIGLHLRDLCDGSRRAEEFLPKAARLSTGSFAVPKSALTRESQEIVVRALGQHCQEAEIKARRILWITGPRPADEVFLAPWLHGHPGLLTVLLPDAAESQDVTDRLAAYPGVESAKGPVSADAIATLTRENGRFDAVIAPYSLNSEQCEVLAESLLPGGLLLVCASERTRFSDFLPLGSDIGLMGGDSSAASMSQHFADLRTVALSPAGEGGPSVLIAVRQGDAHDTPSAAGTMRSMVIPLDANAEPGAERLTHALASHGPSLQELLPPFGAEAASVWEKLMNDHQPDQMVFVSVPPEKGPERPADVTTKEICAISTCLKATAKVRPRCTINILTKGAFSGKGPVDWTNAALWGYARVARNEFGQLHIRCVDTSSDLTQPETAKDLAAEIAANDSEDEVLIGTAGRLASRVVSETQAGASDLGEGERLTLDFDTPGPFQNLHWKRRPSRAPSEGEVAIEAKAAGLNFRDVMYAMGLLPDEALEGGFAGQTLGMELAGVVKAVGPGVEDFSPGDEVIAFAPASFSSETVTSVGAVIPKPRELSFAAAATIPAAFYTAYHALVELAQLQPGERVLIHGAAGGVGIAAVQIARHAGAEVFATAGSEDKRDFVRLLGADHVFNSRTLDFADDIMRTTDGEGVDVVLNSLAGEAVTKNLEILRPFGRLLELGKRDFYENNRIGLRPFRHNIRYFVVDADQVMALRPDMAARGFRQLLELFRQRVLSPLPLTIFPAAEAAEAFRYMQHSNQTGKVVLDLSDIPCSPAPRLTKAPEPLFSSQGTYLVTGGWSGFGLETARWLVSKGARSLALLGRRGPVGEAAEQFVEECRRSGILLLTEPGDVTSERSLGAILQKIRSELPPLRGVFHAATVIEDALIMNLDATKVEAVLAPKLTGAAMLDRLTRQDPIDHFVLYSSATTFFGNPGQAAYVAANTALEELAVKRQQEGLAATCISWGPIGDTGYLSRHEQIKETLAARIGGQPLESADALRFLGLSLANSTSQVAWMDLDWGALARFLPSATNPRYQMLHHLRGSGSGSAEGASDLRRELERMEPVELLETLKGLLKEEIGNILRVAPDKLDENRSLLEVGMDSLMGVELMTSLETNLGLSIPIMALSEGPTISRLAERLAHVIRPPENAEETADSPLAEHARQLAAQHAADVSSTDIAELVADIEQSKKS